MESIIYKANALIKRYKTRNPFELAEYLNITIKYGKFSKLKGFYNYSYRNRFVVLNSRLDEAEQIITCCHELGHDRLHRSIAKLGLMKDYNIYNISDTCEIEANLFTAQLLIDDNDIFDYATMGYTSSQIAAELNVHEELVLMKATILNKQGHKFTIPYIPDLNYLGKK